MLEKKLGFSVRITLHPSSDNDDKLHEDIMK